MNWPVYAALLGMMFVALSVRTLRRHTRTKPRVLLVAAIALLSAQAVQADDACSFQPPRPVLLPNAYPGQTMARQSENRLTEQARLHGGLRIEIRQSACADFVTTEFTLLVPDGQGRQSGQDGWIELARSTIAGLKTSRPAPEFKELDDFLGRAKGLRSRQGVIGACRDGSGALPGECAWESLGGFVLSVQRTGHGTRIAVTQYLSG